MNKLLVCVVCILITACHSAKSESVASPGTAPAPANEPIFKTGPQPTAAELREAISRNYDDAVMIDDRRPSSFLTGDFNGDNSEDVAVVVRPGKGKLEELNSEFANWILEDPHDATAVTRKANAAPIQIAGNDVLVAVIHGHEREGWRNTLARQTYLLKNVGGDEFVRMTASELRKDNKTLPQLRGDVIRETLNGTPGIIFWTGARYAWHPVI